MNKYVIDLRPDCKVVQEICESDGKVSIGAKSINYLEELNSDYINEHFGDLQDTAYQRGLEDGKQTAIGAAELREKLEYQKGFEDGKAQSERGCEGCKYSGTPQGDSPCYNCSNYYKNNWTAKDDEIEVGDEVTYKSDSVKWTAIVTRISCGTLTLMEHSGAIADNYPIEDFVKTGRHFDIASILEAMKHD